MSEALVFSLSTQAHYSLIGGVDEVGRGPLAGDVVAAAVILDVNKPIPGLNDSKKLSEKKRNALFPLIQEHSLAYAIGRSSPEEIDEINILQASLLAMKRAVQNLSLQAEFVYVDGNRLPDWQYNAQAIVKGDSKILSIAAASVLAKVTRDTELEVLDKQYPGYGLAQHKGYPTKAHMDALQALGPSPIHRKSFKPVAQYIKSI